MFEELCRCLQKSYESGFITLEEYHNALEALADEIIAEGGR